MRSLFTTLLVFVLQFCNGQSSNIPERVYSKFSDAMKEIICYLPNLQGKQDSILSKICAKSYSDNVKGVLRLEDANLNHWNVEASSFWASGESAYYFGDGIFSNLRVENQNEVAGIPIRLHGDLVMQNGQVNTRLSALGIEVDCEKLLNNYKAGLSGKIIQESFNNLSESKQRLLEEHLSIEASRSTILSPDYALRKTALMQRLDSVSQSISNKADTTLLDSLNRWKNLINQTEYTIDSIYRAGLSRWTEVQHAMQSWQSLAEIEQEKLEVEITKRKGRSAKDLGELRAGFKSILLNFKQLRIGSYRMQSTPFDLSSIPLNGIKIEFQRGGYYAAVCYGKEGKQQQQFPDYVRNFRLAGQGRSIFQIKTGIGGVEKSHLHLSVSTIGIDGINETSSSAPSKQNVIVGVESRYLIAENVFADVIASFSAADFTGQSNTKELFGSLSNHTTNIEKKMASLVKFGWKRKGGNAEYAIGYQTVGSEYVTLGNLFLLQNRHAVRLEGKQRFLKNKGQCKIVFVQGASNATNETSADVHQNQFSGELSYRVGKKGSRIWANYSPSYFSQNGQGASSTQYQLNLVTVGTQWMMHRSQKGQWITMLQMTNFSDQSQFGDTSVVTDLLYLMVTPTYASNKYRTTLLINTGFDKKTVNSIRDFNIDWSQSFMLPKIQITQGFQMVKRYYSVGWLLGGSGGIQFQMGKQLRASIGGTYYIGLSHGEKNQFYMNTNVGWQF